ncbi:DUF302 domain-containing protein [Natronorubrum bangense]|uniref:DUF302 domain-containing protein n=2 Tax=Natronorubrum bangense TaxID=61858 RepID=L9W6E7_9EURY|nr:DUF302 domain-containing protein [Natronorubrum bangense]ELY44927.1 hypothetical protein C494_16728 [Natronorubrum bangense JCM 10635]QCC54984.1 DUF302 domain-containing protein [Natronorubrum bangense]
MTLPIDPATIDPDEYGEKQVVLEMDHEEAIEHVREVCTDAGFGIPVEFSPSELLNEKVDADRDPYYVLGACNPAVANKALEQSLQIGGLFPCNMVIWEEAPGRQRVYHVSIMRIARLLGMAPDNDAWDEILEETGELTEQAFTKLEAAEAAQTD